MSDIHSQITDSDEIHVPKGFVEAGDSTLLIKNESSTLEWVSTSAVSGPPGPTGPAGTISRVSVADIDDPSIEFALIDDTDFGEFVFAVEDVAGSGDIATLYYYDTNITASLYVPYVMSTAAGGNTRWCAYSGKYSVYDTSTKSGGRPITSAEQSAITANTAKETATKQMWFSAGNDVTQENGYACRSGGSTAITYFSFVMPHDFTSLTSLEVICFSDANIVSGDIDITSNYGAVGEAISTHTEIDDTSTYNFTADEMKALDASGIFTSVAANDVCGLTVDHNGVGTTVNYLGIKLRYS